MECNPQPTKPYTDFSIEPVIYSEVQKVTSLSCTSHWKIQGYRSGLSKKLESESSSKGNLKPQGSCYLIQLLEKAGANQEVAGSQGRDLIDLVLATGLT